MLVGDDDGTRSRLRAVDPAAGCASTVAVESAVIRSGDPRSGPRGRVRAPRRPAHARGPRRLAAFHPGRTAVPVLPGLAPDTRHGPTFATDLRWASDGRLAVASCGELACRTRVVDPATGTVVATAGTGPVVGVLDSRVIAFDVCPRLPVRAARRRSGDDRDPADRASRRPGRARRTRARASGMAGISSCSTRTRAPEATSPDPTATSRSLPVRLRGPGSTPPRGMVSLETIGRPLEPSTARRLDPASPAIEPVEVMP